MESEKPEMTDAQIDAIVDAIGADGGDKLLADMLKEESDQPAAPATSAKDIRIQMKAIAAKKPELVARIISHWITEERRKR